MKSAAQFSTVFTYLGFLLKSTNQHGIHSPFVFRYITECLYRKPRLSKNRMEDILFKSIPFFGSKNIHVVDDKALESQLKQTFPNLNYENPPFDIMVFKHFNYQTLIRIMQQKGLHNNSMVLVNALPKNQLEWKKAIAHSKITVSIDCYSVGFLFLRKEQVKEHFTIRL